MLFVVDRFLKQITYHSDIKEPYLLSKNRDLLDEILEILQERPTLMWLEKTQKCLNVLSLMYKGDIIQFQNLKPSQHILLPVKVGVLFNQIKNEFEINYRNYITGINYITTGI